MKAPTRRLRGLRPWSRGLTPCDQALREPNDLPNSLLPRQAATPTAPDFDEFVEDGVIIQGRYLLDLEMEFLKDFEELLDPLSRLGPPAVDVSKPNEGQGLPYDIWAEETQPGIHAAPIEGIDRFPRDLHVLLRHRPRSISRRMSLWPRLFADDVLALARVSVVAGDVPAAVDHPAHGFDAEVGIAPGPVARQLCGAACDVEAIVARAGGDVAP